MSEQPKFTPGPWEWRVVSDGWDGQTSALYGRDRMVLIGWGYDACGIYFGQEAKSVESEPDLPDARLIAAAPDLYAALRGLLACCTSSDGAVGPEPHCRREWLQFMLDARAAIAKAEGRQE